MNDPAAATGISELIYEWTTTSPAIEPEKLDDDLVNAWAAGLADDGLWGNDTLAMNRVSNESSHTHIVLIPLVMIMIFIRLLTRQRFANAYALTELCLGPNLLLKSLFSHSISYYISHLCFLGQRVPFWLWY